MNFFEKLVELAESCAEYEDFEKQALEITPSHLRGAVEGHLLEWYVDFRYPDQSREEEEE